MKIWGKTSVTSLLAVALLFGVLMLLRWSFVEQVDAQLFDLVTRVRGPQAPDSRVTVVAIDDFSLQEIGPWPWPPELMDRLFELIQAAQPSVLSIDLLLNQPFNGTASGDGRSLVVLATSLVRSQNGSGESLVWHDSGRYAQASDLTLAHVHAGKTADGVCRSIPLEISYHGQRRWALSIEAVRIVSNVQEADVVLTRDSLRVGEIKIPRLQGSIDEDFDSAAALHSLTGDRLLINFRGPTGTFAYVSAADVLAEKDSALEALRSKIVIVGATSYSLGDHLSTPFSGPDEMPGVEIHANAIDTILNQRFITIPGEPGLALLLLAVLGWTWLIFEEWSGGWAAYLFAGTFVTVFALPVASLIWFSHWIPLASLVLAVALAGASRQILRFMHLNRLLNSRFLQLSRLLSGSSSTGSDMVLSHSNSSFRHLGLEWKIDLLGEASHAALKTAQTKEEMLSFVSHELKTPLTSIRGFADLLSEWERLTPEDRSSSVQLIGAEAERLTKMVTDYLDLARLESGALKLRETPCHIGDLLIKAYSSLEPLFRKKRIRMQGLDELPQVEVRGDCELLTQAFGNLLSNAVKYSPSDSTVVAALSYDSSYIQLSVHDEGFGIALPDQEKLFEKFFRSSSQDEEGPGGSGLGLAIVKEIVEQHSGQVTVESELGEGSIFRVRLPLA